MGGFAWVTLATNDSYSLGALVLAHSLKQAGTTQQLAVLVTPGVTNAMREKLQTVFNLVQEVNILDSRDEANLKLLKRPELGVTFTKLHCWRLTQYEKCVFLDADTLVLQNCDELFEREELSAAPDVGWPDCFNSGVFVYRPSNDTFEKLIQFALEKGSFDGGDQGLLNLYFSDWAHKDISKHLPFIYNMCSTACYSYLPAYKQFGANAKIIHFIGATKPWLQYFNTETRRVQPSGDSGHLEGVLQRWWEIFCSLIHPQLSPEMPEGRSQQYHSNPSHSHSYYNPPNQSTHESSSASDFQNDYDPWDDYDQNQSEISQNSSQIFSYSQESTSFHNSLHAQPNESPNTNASFVAEHHSHQSQTQTHDYYSHQTHEYHQNAATQHEEPQQSDIHHTTQYDFHLIESHNEEPRQHYNALQNDNKQNYPEHQNQSQQHSDIHQTPQYNYQLIESYNDNHHNQYSEPCIEHIPQEQSISHHVEHNETHYHDPPPSQSHNDSQYHETHHNHRSPYLSPNRDISSLPEIPNECKATDIVSNDVLVAHSSEENEDNAGLAGAFARLTLGVARTPEQDAFESVLRKQAWEVGNIDYMGKDSFDNILSKISQTLASAPVEAQVATEDVATSKEAVKETAVKADTTVSIEPTVAEEKSKVEVAVAAAISETLVSPPVQTSTPISQEEPAKVEASLVTPVSVVEPVLPPVELKSEPQTPALVSESETKVDEKVEIASGKVEEDSILVLEKQPLPEVPLPVEVVSEVPETSVEEIRQTESVKETEALQVQKQETVVPQLETELKDAKFETILESKTPVLVSSPQSQTDIGESKPKTESTVLPKEIEAPLECKKPESAPIEPEPQKLVGVPSTEVATGTPTDIKSEIVTPQPQKDATLLVETKETKIHDTQTKHDSKDIELPKKETEEVVQECKKPESKLEGIQSETKPVLESEKSKVETTQPEIPESKVTQPTPPVTPSSPPVESLPQLEKVKALAVESNVPSTPPPSSSQDSSPTPPPRKEGKPKKGIPKPKK